MTALHRKVSAEDFRNLTHRRPPKSVFEFVDGRAGQELPLIALASAPATLKSR
ncbi:hypothetical protein [Mesorhizobium sp. Mes31]|uniref:hypothetical protein n=1 Tax=Mesorhizobium sp. Mes31 TaxID=2926017 RepID=UPI00211943A9|nr:hypothetical protein [Mesorhizobium sp. Mes31]